MSDQEVFHAGEQAVQRKLGVFDEIGPWARKVVRPDLPEQHRDFYRALPFLVAAARDRQGRPWATVLAGEPGFVASPDPQHLRIAAQPTPGDALDGELVSGSEIGLLGIELATRRRNRVNGQISRADGAGLLLEVGQAFGNCPQYISEREWERVEPHGREAAARRHRDLTPALRLRIESADTFFIATGHRGEGHSVAFGMDASHRGGPPGFVKIQGERRLVFPDYAGNNHFNTIGNLVADPRAGLLFVDFERGGLLQLTGRATVDWDSPAVSEHKGARRLVLFDIDEAVELDAVLPIRWSREGGSMRSLRLVEKSTESRDVTSFVFEARDGGVLPDFEPGQHLPIELQVPGEERAVRRTYSLSNAPGEQRYRISVKRELRGLASRFLHDALEEGAFVDARTPAGEFVLTPGDRPIVLVSAGVGVTPMISMLRDVVTRGDPRGVVFVHAARDGEHHPFAEEARRLVASRPGIESHVFYSRPLAADDESDCFDHVGRLDAERLATLLPDEDVDIYLCGPVGFMAQIQQGLEAHGVAADRIHSESFGPQGS